MFQRILASMLVLNGITGLSIAQDSGNEIKKEESQAEDYTSAASIDFAAKLDLGFRSLATLGARIEQCRQAPDPVGLAAAAEELAVAEKVSGKQAGVTAEELRKSAIELAKLRGDQHELQAVAMLTGDRTAKKELQTEATKAAARAEELKAAAEAGEKSKGIYGQLIIDNQSHYHVDIFYNGRSVGYANGHGHAHLHIHDHSHSHVFDLVAKDHHGHYWRKHVHGDYNNFHWTIHPPHHHH